MTRTRTTNGSLAGIHQTSHRHQGLGVTRIRQRPQLFSSNAHHVSVGTQSHHHGGNDGLDSSFNVVPNRGVSGHVNTHGGMRLCLQQMGITGNVGHVNDVNRTQAISLRATHRGDQVHNNNRGHRNVAILDEHRQFIRFGNEETNQRGRRDIRIRQLTHLLNDRRIPMVGQIRNTTRGTGPGLFTLFCKRLKRASSATRQRNLLTLQNLNVIHNVHHVSGLSTLVQDVNRIGNLGNGILTDILRLLMLQRILNTLGIGNTLTGTSLITHATTNLLRHIIGARTHGLILRMSSNFLIFPINLSGRTLSNTASRTRNAKLFLGGTRALLTLRTATLPLLITGVSQLVKSHRLNTRLDRLLTRNGRRHIRTNTHRNKRNGRRVSVIRHNTLGINGLINHTQHVTLINSSSLQALQGLNTVLLRLAISSTMVLGQITVLGATHRISSVRSRHHALSITRRLITRTLTLTHTLSRTKSINGSVKMLTNARRARIKRRHNGQVINSLKSNNARTHSGQKLTRQKRTRRHNVDRRLRLRLGPILLNQLTRLNRYKHTTRQHRGIHVTRATNATKHRGSTLTVVRRINGLRRQNLHLKIRLTRRNARKGLRGGILTTLAIAANALPIHTTLNTRIVLGTMVSRQERLDVNLSSSVTTAATITTVKTTLKSGYLTPGQRTSNSTITTTRIGTTSVNRL